MMTAHSFSRLITTFSVLVSMSGCASVMSGSRKNISISSEPAGAHVSVADKRGREVASLTTPCVASLKRGAGYFVGASYVATIEKPGFQAQKFKIDPTFNPWVLGNAVVGGLVGIIIIDPISGAMFSLSPSEIDARLLPLKR